MTETDEPGTTMRHRELVRGGAHAAVFVGMDLARPGSDRTVKAWVGAGRDLMWWAEGPDDLALAKWLRTDWRREMRAEILEHAALRDMLEDDPWK